MVLHGKKKKMISWMIGKVNILKLQYSDNNRLDFDGTMVHSFPFDENFDDKFEEIRLYLVDAAFNFTFQCFSACGFVGVNL
jgi:hypothetical protein